ncbi:MAG TPA: hypothetical protein VJ890_10450 [Vineibacter sp.]|nr:hypothetical protein [Vineibacter sp.]
MANSTPTDPIAMWRDFVSQWEKSVNQLSNQTMGTPEFSGTMNKAAGLSYALQQTMSDMLSRYQTAANMPTRADISAIGERLLAMEATLNRVAAIIERMPIAGEAPSTRTALPPRTRKPPSRAPAASAQASTPEAKQS